MRTTRANYAKAARAGAVALDRLRPGHQGVELLRSIALRFEQPIPESAKAPKSEWATMQDEITRKALQVVQEAMTKQEAGTITERELWCIVDALFDTTHGLIPKDTSDVLYRARQELKEHAPQ